MAPAQSPMLSSLWTRRSSLGFRKILKIQQAGRPKKSVRCDGNGFNELPIIALTAKAMKGGRENAHATTAY